MGHLGPSWVYPHHPGRSPKPSPTPAARPTRWPPRRVRRNAAAAGARPWAAACRNRPGCYGSYGSYGPRGWRSKDQLVPVGRNQNSRSAVCDWSTLGEKNFQPPTNTGYMSLAHNSTPRIPQLCPRIPSRKVFTKAQPAWAGINSEQLVRGNRLKTGCLKTSNGRWLTNGWSRYSQDEAGKTCLGLEQLVTHLSHMPKTTHPRKLVPLPPNFFIKRTDIFLLYSCETKYLFYTFLSSSFPLMRQPWSCIPCLPAIDPLPLAAKESASVVRRDLRSQPQINRLRGCPWGMFI